MLNKPLSNYRSVTLRTSQRGVVLVIALIVLVIMTLAGIALMRSVDTSNIIAGNLAFQQSATHTADRAVEQAVAWLEDCNGAKVTCPANPPFNSDAGSGYNADGLSIVNLHIPAAGQTWDDYWKNVVGNNFVTLNIDGAGNTPSYIIDRLCQAAGDPSGGAACAKYPITSMVGNDEEGGTPGLAYGSLIYYRVTVRTVGPRNTVSYIQALVAM
jgi:Tfp pilus assembly protein PilX